MYPQNKMIERLASEPGAFSVRGEGALYFTDECDRLQCSIGEIVVARDSHARPEDIYVEVSSKGKQFLMPIHSVNKIKWDRKTKG